MEKRLYLFSLIWSVFQWYQIAHGLRKTYDYVIVGGGTAGCVLANRLSANPDIDVLLLEAGDVPHRMSDMPFYQPVLQLTELDWNYYSVPQKYSCFGLGEQRMRIPRGKALGGSSVINNMMFVRGNEVDFDKWAENGADGWSWKDVFPYFMKFENNQNDFIVSNGRHGTQGEMFISRTNYYTKLSQEYVEAAKEINFKEGDFNGPDPESFMVIQGYINQGRRWTTYKGYIKPIEKRKNLHIAVGAFATKILFDSNKRATGVSFDHKNETKVALARREVILSAGVINSAQLLMLSGIGPRQHLQSLGIPVLSDLPVGQNLQDHVTVALPFSVQQEVTLQMFRTVILGMLPFYFGKGPLSAFGVETVGFFTSKYNNHTRWPDVEMSFASFSPCSDGGIVTRKMLHITDELWEKVFKPYSDTDTYLCYSVVLHPLSKGEMKLSSTNPYHYPLIDPRYLENPRDMDVLLEGMKKCLEIADTKTMRKYGTRPFNVTFPGCEQFQRFSDKYLECVARVFTSIFNHPIGTCKMGNPTDPTTVVDPQLRVKGIEGLRVIDASVIPTIVSGHTEATAIMIGEKGSDIVLSDYYKSRRFNNF